MSQEPEIRMVADMQRLEVRPGDVFVLTTAHTLSAEMAERMVRHAQQVLGEHAKILVIDRSVELGVIGRGT